MVAAHSQHFKKINSKLPVLLEKNGTIKPCSRRSVRNSTLLLTNQLKRTLWEFQQAMDRTITLMRIKKWERASWLREKTRRGGIITRNKKKWSLPRLFEKWTLHASRLVPLPKKRAPFYFRSPFTSFLFRLVPPKTTC